MRYVIVFLFVCFYFPNIAFAKYCTEADDIFRPKLGVKGLDNLYEFALNIQKAFKDKDLPALRSMMKIPLINKTPLTFFENKKFDDVFTKEEIKWVLESKIECRAVGIDKGWMLGPGTIWYEDVDGPTISSVNISKYKKNKK
jgi:hypothetical protein